MSDFLNSWGGLISLSSAIISLIGLIAAFIGLIAALKAAHRASKAREAAEEARRETRTAMTRALTTVDLERAIALVQRLNELQRDGRWEISQALYPTLMTNLSDINSRHPAITPELQQQLQGAILQITEMGSEVAVAIREGSEPSEFQAFNRILNNIHVSLLNISGSIQFFHEQSE